MGGGAEKRIEHALFSPHALELYPVCETPGYQTVSMGDAVFSLRFTIKTDVGYAAPGIAVVGLLAVGSLSFRKEIAKRRELSTTIDPMATLC